MDEEQILALIEKTLGEKVGTAVAEATKGLSEQIQALKAKAPKAKEEKTPKTEETTEGDDSPLAKAVKDLQQKLAAKEAQEAQTALERTVDGLLDGYNLRVSRATAKKLLLAEYQGAQATEAGYVLKDGTLLPEAIKGFFGTEDGKALLKAKRTVQGTEVEEGRTTTTVTSGSKSVDFADLDF